jgi:hypothetical protein
MNQRRPKVLHLHFYPISIPIPTFAILQIKEGLNVHEMIRHFDMEYGEKTYITDIQHGFQENMFPYVKTIIRKYMSLGCIQLLWRKCKYGDNVKKTSRVLIFSIVYIVPNFTFFSLGNIH